VALLLSVAWLLPLSVASPETETNLVIIASENEESHPQKTRIEVGDDVSRSEADNFLKDAD